MWTYFLAFVIRVLIVVLIRVLIWVWWADAPVRAVLVVDGLNSYYAPFTYGMSWEQFRLHLNSFYTYQVRDSKGGIEELSSFNYDWFTDRLQRGHVLYLKRLN